MNMALTSCSQAAFAYKHTDSVDGFTHADMHLVPQLVAVPFLRQFSGVWAIVGSLGCRPSLQVDHVPMPSRGHYLDQDVPWFTTVTLKDAVSRAVHKGLENALGISQPKFGSLHERAQSLNIILVYFGAKHGEKVGGWRWKRARTALGTLVAFAPLSLQHLSSKRWGSVVLRLGHR